MQIEHSLSPAGPVAEAMRRSGGRISFSAGQVLFTEHDTQTRCVPGDVRMILPEMLRVDVHGVFIELACEREVVFESRFRR